MSPSAVLPNSARERAGRLLWDRLLAPTLGENDPETDEQDDEERPDEAA
jgi:hypothetical protein